jgi:hypothetical protein
LGLTGIFQIKLGKAIPRFPAVSEASHYAILAWIGDIAPPLQFQADGHDQCTTQKLLGAEWQRYRYMQLLHGADHEEGAPRLTDLTEPEAQANEEATDHLAPIPE